MVEPARKPVLQPWPHICSSLARHLQMTLTCHCTSYNRTDPSKPHAEIVHHEDLPRLRQLHDTIVSTRQQVAGCTDPDATKFQPRRKRALEPFLTSQK